ncbi:hypothetical protein TVAG_315790 [Trichomonas vaginalis G3]|uniref:ArnT-like N-terminal domain-containing protein n=1 Tax=Trichomonas vaginalis (strain ATCC PRA-98 / G3) TaxID=412133 RepID=A2FLN8_TRIV3|nr:dolichyl-phosphate-mannose--protein mannosyltransferase family [Trichomonas vaginalis G3]EAX94173.1 hypothetical protein TVAG_315790 [Trichomonas vaginalis G3]KAI5540673.1 dolichyl-phosphate-mannose--protein mannosyltransferase family [Trichomonas vaginalis G3]|eukprot:XP_001307103.1 hypothetical protein [Trichomonas vaginalis G3]
MIRKNGKTLHQKEPIFQSSHFWIIYFVFSLALVFHVIGHKYPPILIKQEKEIYECFQNFVKGKVLLDNKPLSGRFLLYIPYSFLIKDTESEFPKNWQYLRLINAIIGSFYAPLITASLILFKFSPFTSCVAGILLSLDGSSLVATKLYTTDSLLLLFISLTIFLGILAERTNINFLREIQGIFTVLACVTDTLGLVAFFYFIFVNNRYFKSLQSAVSMFLIFFTIELILKSQFSDDIKIKLPDDATFKEQIALTIQLIRLQYNPVTDFAEAFYWNLVKLRPTTLWVNDLPNMAQRHVAVHNVPVVIGVSLACLFGILKKESVFFWMTIVITWIFKERNVMNYHVALMFGVIALTAVFEKINEIMQKMMLITFCVVALVFFTFFYPWEFALSIDFQLDYTLNIWNM